MREIVLDTETTGLDPLKGHRVVDIGCVELLNHVPSGKVFQTYLNPEREMPKEAAEIHGLTDDFLAQQPVFSEKVEEFLAFIGDDRLVIHNAAFDLGFLNAELVRHGFAQLDSERALDTVFLARKKFPGAPASLDALCKRFSIDVSSRALHGALLDAQLLASVYLELIGGRQPDLALKADSTTEANVIINRNYRKPRPHQPSTEELANHETFLETIKNPLWRRL